MINQKLLNSGVGEFFLDTVNLKHQDELIKAANQAHDQRTGLWSACVEDKNVGCMVKGNLDKLDHRLYHLPGFTYYDAVVVNLGHGDRWFCSEAQPKRPDFNRPGKDNQDLLNLG